MGGQDERGEEGDARMAEFPADAKQSTRAIWERLGTHGERLVAVETDMKSLRESLTEIKGSVRGTNKRLDSLIVIGLVALLGLAVQLLLNGGV